MPMTLHVREVCQTASGGSYFCVFDAEVELTTDGLVQVTVESVEPPDSPQDLIEEARDAIREGASQVLEPRGQGALIKVTRLVIHIIDFRRDKFTFYTVRELQKLMSNECE